MIMRMKRWIGLALVLALLCGMAAFASAEEAGGYQVGDKLEDFTVTLSDGTEVSLYGLLAEKKAVYINLWASWCTPCMREFPHIEQAYREMEDQLAVLALSSGKNDTDAVILALKEQLGLTILPMGRDIGLARRSPHTGLPISMIVDRNGVVCFCRAGTIPDTDSLLRLFSIFTAEDYTEPVLLDDVPAAMPTSAQPTAEALGAALGIQGDRLRVEPVNNPTLWPFLPAEDGSCAQAANGLTMNSTAALEVSVSAKAGEALAYDYAADFNANLNMLLVAVDGTVVSGHGNQADWATDAVRFETAGEHTVRFTYTRGLLTTADTSVRLRNLRVLSAAEAEAAQPARPAQTLPGVAGEVDVLEGETRAVIITREGSEKRSRVHLLETDAMTLRFRIGEGVNPKLAYFYSNGEFRMLDSLERDAEGYLYRYRKGDLPPEFGCGSVIVYASLAEEAHDQMVAFYEWFESEAAIEQYLADSKKDLEKRGQTDVVQHWMYEDAEEAPVLASFADDQAAQPGGMNEYVIVVTDEAGGPVEGAMVQICDEDTCQVVTTGADGTATHTAAPYPYEIHLLMPPQGYAGDDGTYTLPQEGGSVTITLKKQ